MPLLGHHMNESALALAGFGFAVGIVLFIVIELLLAPEPKMTPAPQLAATITAEAAPRGSQPSEKAVNRAATETQQLAPSPVQQDDPVIQAAKASVARN
jgi:hypothetical protein